MPGEPADRPWRLPMTLANASTMPSANQPSVLASADAAKLGSPEANAGYQPATRDQDCEPSDLHLPPHAPPDEGAGPREHQRQDRQERVQKERAAKRPSGADTSKNRVVRA